MITAKARTHRLTFRGLAVLANSIPELANYTTDSINSWLTAPIKEGVLLRNVRAAPICNHFAVVPPSSQFREPVPFLV